MGSGQSTPREHEPPRRPTHLYEEIPFADIVGISSPSGVPDFADPVIPGPQHAELYQVPLQAPKDYDVPPSPQSGADKWDKDHVRMPCSKNSIHVPHNSAATSGKAPSELRWKVIEEALKGKITNSNELAEAILKYNSKYKGTWKFLALHAFFVEFSQEELRNFFEELLPKMVALALELPKLIQTAIPLLQQNMNKSISLTQKQISSLLANAFFCTFPYRNTTNPGTLFANYTKINFSPLYESVQDSATEKLRSIYNYFRRVCNETPNGVVTYSRRYVPSKDCPSWAKSTVPVGSIPVHVNAERVIEELLGVVQVDFSNKYIGSGLLGNGLLQEETKFLMYPELIAAMLFTENLRPTEALMVIGCERYNDFTGYGRNSFRWSGDHRDKIPYDGSRRRRCGILLIDATKYDNSAAQYKAAEYTRELNKAYVGFSFYSHMKTHDLLYPGVATGNWGCGAYNGTPHLKALLQMMACAQAHRPMAYSTFFGMKLKTDIVTIYNELKDRKITVGQLYTALTEYKDNQRLNLYEFLRRQLSL